MSEIEGIVFIRVKETSIACGPSAVCMIAKKCQRLRNSK